ncbi:hypothetical protein MMC32_006775 [Xylographa parallela]|nr:hypothetical protein [Xylographa parallela]
MNFTSAALAAAQEAIHLQQLDQGQAGATDINAIPAELGVPGFANASEAAEAVEGAAYTFDTDKSLTLGKAINYEAPNLPDKIGLKSGANEAFAGGSKLKSILPLNKGELKKIDDLWEGRLVVDDGDEEGRESF